MKFTLPVGLEVEVDARAGTIRMLEPAVSEALSFLDQSLDAGFRPGMGHIVPDRFFWALAPDDEEPGSDDAAADDGSASGPEQCGQYSVPSPDGRSVAYTRRVNCSSG